MSDSTKPITKIKDISLMKAWKDSKVIDFLREINLCNRSD